VQDIFWVSLGAVLGANARFNIYTKFEQFNLSKYSSILIINTSGSFFLGLFLSILPKIRAYDFSHQLVLFLLIGFLSSFSTFSSFVYDLFEVCMKLEFFRALNIFFTSLILGIIALAFGLFFGNY
tara:strand:- start:191 stop:565 length:375 start_codon:yes stop_codon:yes gene_type:complete